MSGVARDAVQVTASLGPASIHIGDHAELTVSVIHPATMTASPPAVRDGSALVPFGSGTRVAGLDVVAAGPPQRSESPGGNVETRFTYRLTSFDVGSHALPELVVAVADGKDSIEASAPAQKLEVASLLAATKPAQGATTAEPDIRDIKGPLTVAPDYSLWVVILAGTLVLLVAAALVRRAWRRRGRAAPPPTPRLPPYEEAVAALATLRARGLPATGAWKEFALDLSEIVRRYVGRRYAFNALESTTREVLRELGGQRELEAVARDRSPLQSLRQLLEETDLIKFAKVVPEMEAETVLLEGAAAFLETTRSVPSVELAAPVGAAEVGT